MVRINTFKSWPPNGTDSPFVLSALCKQLPTDNTTEKRSPSKRLAHSSSTRTPPCGWVVPSAQQHIPLHISHAEFGSDGRTHIDLDAQRRKRSHGRILLRREAKELSASFVPLDAVQTVPLQVIAALQYRILTPLHRRRHDHHHVAQWLHQSCNRKGENGRNEVVRLIQQQQEEEEGRGGGEERRSKRNMQKFV